MGGKMKAKANKRESNNKKLYVKNWKKINDMKLQRMFRPRISHRRDQTWHFSVLENFQKERYSYDCVRNNLHVKLNKLHEFSLELSFEIK